MSSKRIIRLVAVLTLMTGSSGGQAEESPLQNSPQCQISPETKSARVIAVEGQLERLERENRSDKDRLESYLKEGRELEEVNVWSDRLMTASLALLSQGAFLEARAVTALIGELSMGKGLYTLLGTISGYSALFPLARSFVDERATELDLDVEWKNRIFIAPNLNFLTSENCVPESCFAYHPEISQALEESIEEYNERLDEHQEKAWYWAEFFSKDYQEEYQKIRAPYAAHRIGLRLLQIKHLKRMKSLLREGQPYCLAQSSTDVVDQVQEGEASSSPSFEDIRQSGSDSI